MNVMSNPARLSHAARLEKLAEVAVKVGLGLQPGQELVMTAPVEALDLSRAITRAAYRAGAGLVTTILGDEQAALLRYEHAQPDTFDHAAGWLFEGMANAYRVGAARLAIVGDNPTLLAACDPEKVSRANRARSKAYQPALEQIVSFSINWTLVAAATPAWARMVFPNEPEEVAVARLWDAIFAASRIDSDDPVAGWAEHNALLDRRTTHLNAKRYHALHFRGPNADLSVGLADDHAWVGGASRASNGIICNPNIPTEEVFTTPHRERIEGRVRATKPLSYQGTLIEDIEVRFEKGVIVEANARTGADVLRRVLDTDEGARRLGEVALVPFSSPISASGLLFYNTLFDENAASHIALGQAYSQCFVDPKSMSESDLHTAGANRSLIHIDWMIGSAQMDVDGIFADGTREPVMRQGAFVF